MYSTPRRRLCLLRQSVRLLRPVSAQHSADVLGGVLHEAINHAVISEHEDATLHLWVRSELFAAFVARRCTCERAVVMAQPDGGTVDAPMTMFHGQEAITTANRSAALPLGSSLPPPYEEPERHQELSDAIGYATEERSCEVWLHRFRA